MINSPAASSIDNAVDDSTDTTKLADDKIARTTITAAIIPTLSSNNSETIIGNKIFATNVIESTAVNEMYDDASPESNTITITNDEITTIVCGSDSNNSLNCTRNGIDRKDTLNSLSSGGSGCTIPRTESNSAANHLSPATSSLSPIQLSPCRSLDSVNDDDFDEITRLFESKSKLIERWLREKAAPDVLSRIHAAADYARLSKSPKRTSSVTSDLFQMWLASSPVQVSADDVVSI